MSNLSIEKSFELLKTYCERNEFRGWDPYDGLNSRVFQSIPLIRNNRLSRLAWIQFFKRNPFNLRRLLLVNKDYNTKGLGLFLTGYCNLYSIEKKKEHLDHIHFLAEKIISLQNNSYSGSCWGYNFDWQARAFFQPAGTPTVVATSFVADALFNAYDLLGEKTWLDTALSSTRFVLNDLSRTVDEGGDLCFSYSPLDTTCVYNASLLGARLLARAWSYQSEPVWKDTARKAVSYVCRRQQESGAWSYGELPFHQWVDNFHTGFNLECISDYARYTGDRSFAPQQEKGLRFYTGNFFTEKGEGKYYHDRLYPIDIHSPAQLMVTLSKLEVFPLYKKMAEQVMNWTIRNMQDREGYFYYQKKKGLSSRIPYMRWAQAWMFYSMSYYLKQQKEHAIATN